MPVLAENSTASAEEELIWKLPPAAIVASGSGKAEYVKLSTAKCVPLPIVPRADAPRGREHEIRHAIKIELKPCRRIGIHDNSFLIDQHVVIVAVDRDTEAIIPGPSQVSANKVEGGSTNGRWVSIGIERDVRSRHGPVGYPETGASVLLSR